MKRLKENKPLPSRWVQKHGAYYYLPPAEQRYLWDGKTWFRLGSTLAEAYRVWAQRVEASARITNIGALLERYLLEVVPKKAPKTATENLRQIQKLLPVFAKVNIQDLEPQHIYQYVDKRAAKVAAKREIEVLSHALTKAVQWGLIKSHPFKGEVRLEGEKPRTRYVEDWELEAAFSIPPNKKVGSVRMVQAYLQLKMMTGLRQRDLLSLTMDCLKDDGIHVTPSKTQGTSGKKVIYTWTPQLRIVVDVALQARPYQGDFIFCNRDGNSYVKADGTATGWGNIWQRFMIRVLAETDVKERFTEHDLRAKVASDAHSIEYAKQLLMHSDIKMTERVYRRKPELVKPTK